MLRIIIAFLLVNLMIFNANAEGPIRIVAFGDSLVSGYGVKDDESFPAKLESYLQKRGYDAVVVNEGFNGETAKRARNRIDSIMDHNPDVVILQHGMSDVFVNAPIDEITESLDDLIMQFKEKKIKVILAGMQVFSERGGQSYSDKFNKIHASLAEKHNLVLYPFFLKGVAEKPKLNIGDGVHPNSKGISVIVKNFFPYIEKVIR